MSLTATLSLSVQGAGLSIQQQVVRTADGAGSRQIAIPAAQGGSLTTRTSNTVGTITMTSGAHTITTGMTVDLYWAGGMRYGVTVGTVSATAVPFTAGAGDNLPSSPTAIAVCQQVVVNAQIDGDLLSLIAFEAVSSNPANQTDKAHINFVDVTPASVAALSFLLNTVSCYDITGGATNVLTGNVILQCLCSNGSLTDTVTMNIIWVGDSTP